MKHLQHLKQLAEAATPGPWVVDYEVYHGMTTADVKEGAIVKREIGRNVHIVDQPKNFSVHPDDTDLRLKQKRDFSNAAYIAAMHPDQTLRLIKALDRAVTYLESFDPPLEGEEYLVKDIKDELRIIEQILEGNREGEGD